MDKQNPLLPFAFSTSSITDEVPLNTAPRNRLIIDENASSMYHTRTTEVRRKGPILSEVPSLKRKMGTSFNEKNDVKRRDTEYEEFESEPTFVDDEPEEENGYQNKFRKAIPPSSPLLDHHMASEFDLSTNTTANYEVPDSPTHIFPSENNTAHDYMNDIPEKKHIVMRKDQQSLSSDADFGIDRFNRFTNKSNQCPSTDRDFLQDSDEYLQLQKKIHNKARDIVIDAFENIETTINLEGMGLQDIPDEIKDFDNLVIFSPEPTTQTSYQLYLTNNSLRYLTPSLFKFTKLNVLGLRRNKLQTLPPLIGNLQHLTDLSLGTNRLEYLPPQILDLYNLQTFRAGPNPFVKIPEDAIPITTSTLNSIKLLKYVSRVRYFGNLKKVIPSLKTHCLNIIAKYDVSYQETKSWKRFTPKIHHGLIATAISKGKYEERCSECDFIIVEPFAEAFEWWDILQNKDVPIKREFCSGKCVKKWELRVLISTNKDEL